MHIPLKKVIAHECMLDSLCSVYPLFIYSKGHGSLTVLISFISFSVFLSLSFLCHLPMILPPPPPPPTKLPLISLCLYHIAQLQPLPCIVQVLVLSIISLFGESQLIVLCKRQPSIDVINHLQYFIVSINILVEIKLEQSAYNSNYPLEERSCFLKGIIIL